MARYSHSRSCGDPFRATTLSGAVLCGLLFGCTGKLEAIDSSVVVACPDGQCPDGFECVDDLVGSEPRCVPAGRDTALPRLAADGLRVTPEFVGLSPNNNADIVATLDEEPAEPPKAELVWGDGTVVELPAPPETSGTEYRFRFSATGTEPEGTAAVRLRALSVLGTEVTEFVSGALQTDFTPPALAVDVNSNPIAAIALEPPANSPLFRVGALGLGAFASVNFAVSETLRESPQVSATLDDDALDFALRSDTGTAFIYELTVEATGVADGVYAVEAQATDRAGNTSTLSLGDVAVDFTPPLSPRVDVDDVVMLVRRPWGDRDSDGAPVSTLTGAAGAAEANSEIFVVADSDPFVEGRLTGILDRIAARDDGSFGGDVTDPEPWVLPVSDRARLYVVAVDNAGNVSDAHPAPGHQAALVRDGVWIATLNGKVPASEFENPHEFRARPVRLPFAVQRGAQGSSEVGRLGAVDGQRVTTAGTGYWRQLSNDNRYGQRQGADLSHNPVAGSSLLIGGQPTGVPSCDAGATCLPQTFDGRRFSALSFTETPDPEGDGTPFNFGDGELAFDESRGVTWAFDGDEMWAWNETSFRRVLPIDPEGDGEPDSVSSMAYDPRRRVVVIYEDARTWEWNGESWTETCTASRCASELPPVTGGHRLDYHNELREVVLFGGADGGTQSDELWSFNGSRWLRRCPSSSCTTSPTARIGHAMSYDASRNRLVVYGGESSSSCRENAEGVCSDVWEWDGTVWSERCTSSRCLMSTPGARTFSSMSFDPIRERVALVAGFAGIGGSQTDYWEWDGSLWAERSDSSGISTSLLPGGIEAAYLPSIQKTVIVDGSASTWTWNGYEIRRLSSTNHPNRTGVSLGATDSEVISYGGRDSGNSLTSTTYSFVGTSWVQECTGFCFTPGARDGVGLAQRSSSRLLSFGGDSGSAVTNLQREWTGSVWALSCTTTACSTSRPSARRSPAMALLESTGDIVLFGGGDPYGSGSFQDTWVYDGTLWQEVAGASGPVAREDAGMVYDSELDAVVMYGGRTTFALGGQQCVTGFFDCLDLWDFDGTQWREPPRSTPFQTARPTEYGPMVYDEARNETVLFADGEIWTWNSEATGKPIHVFEAEFIEAATGAEQITEIAASWVGGGDGTTAGAQLLVWNIDRWTPIASDENAGVSTPGEFAFSARASFPSYDEPELRRLLPGQRRVFRVALSPLGTNGRSQASVVTDYIEVRVAYRLE